MRSSLLVLVTLVVALAPCTALDLVSTLCESPTNCSSLPIQDPHPARYVNIQPVGYSDCIVHGAGVIERPWLGWTDLHNLHCIYSNGTVDQAFLVLNRQARLSAGETGVYDFNHPSFQIDVDWTLQGPVSATVLLNYSQSGWVDMSAYNSSLKVYQYGSQSKLYGAYIPDLLTYIIAGGNPLSTYNFSFTLPFGLDHYRFETAPDNLDCSGYHSVQEPQLICHVGEAVYTFSVNRAAPIYTYKSYRPNGYFPKGPVTTIPDWSEPVPNQFLDIIQNPNHILPYTLVSNCESQTLILWTQLDPGVSVLVTVQWMGSSVNIPVSGTGWKLLNLPPWQVPQLMVSFMPIGPPGGAKVGASFNNPNQLWYEWTVKCWE